MGKQARLFLIGTVVIVTCIMIPMIDSTTNFDKNVMSLLDGDNATGSHADACCNAIGGYLNWARNTTGHTVSKSGLSIELMDWFSLSMKFEYECLPQKDSERRDNETNKNTLTTLYQLKHGFCDISPIPYLFTYARFKDGCDFLPPSIKSQFDLLIPVPHLAIGGISSVWKPFENSVWTVLLVSIAVTMILSLVNWFYNKSRNDNNEHSEVILDIHWLFVFGLSMSKAGFSAPSSFKMRLAGGAWCIAALILTNFYSSVLTSLITTSIPVPIANSVEDMANNDNVALIIVKGFGVSEMISDGKDTNTLFKKLDKKLKSSPNSFCPNQSAIALTRWLREKPPHSYTMNQVFLHWFQRTTAELVDAMWHLPRNHSVQWLEDGPYRKKIHGLNLFNEETGLVDHWKGIYLPKPIQCMGDPSSRQAMLSGIRNPALVNLQGLIPAFVFLFIGFIIASMALLAEWINKLQIWKYLPFIGSPLPPVH